MISAEIRKEFETAAARLDVEAAALLAVAELETGLRAFATVEGRNEPLIRFEGHYFDRRLSEIDRHRARREGLASPQAGAVANPASQAGRWAMLERAAAIDRAAAYESVSWGLGQVMGAHWAWLGYDSVEALAEEARGGIGGQVRLMAAFIDKAGLAGALRTRDWAAFARGYNGPAFHRNAYDTRLAAAYRRHSAAGGMRGDELRIGARGRAVEKLQEDLVRLGYSIAVDGILGPLTERAVRAFQKRSGLDATGVACAATLAFIHTRRERRGDSEGTGSLGRFLRGILSRIFG